MSTADSATPRGVSPICWCGQDQLQPYSSEYLACNDCGTLVSRVGLAASEIPVRDDQTDFYGKEYWLGHQAGDFGYPDIVRRTRADMPQRCMHWLRNLLRYKPPPARVLEIGCAHGGFVALLRSLGYDAQGLELSPWVVEYARKTFDIPVLLGPIEQQKIAPGSLDAIVLSDVVEHLPDPVATLSHCAGLLEDDGVLVVQMPNYPEGTTFEELRARKDRFLEHMEAKACEHLHLFSQRASRRLFETLGFSALAYEQPMFEYDQYVTASRRPLRRDGHERLGAALTGSGEGRARLAWIDFLFDFEAREADRAKRLEIIHRLNDQLRKAGAVPEAPARWPQRVVRFLKRLARAG